MCLEIHYYYYYCYGSTLLLQHRIQRVYRVLCGAAIPYIILHIHGLNCDVSTKGPRPTNQHNSPWIIHCFVENREMYTHTVPILYYTTE